MANYFLTADEVLKMEFKGEGEWMIDQILPKYSIMMLSAAPKSFKTWLALYIASCVSKGEPVFGKFKAMKAGVLFVDEESGLPLLKERLRLMGITGDNLYFSSYRGTKIDDEQDIEWLLELCKQNNIRLIIFDTFIRVHDKEENDASKMRQIFSSLKPLLRSGISLLFLHHHRKDSATGRQFHGSQLLRGSSEISSFINCLFSISVKDKDGIFVLRNELMRNSKNLEDLVVKISIGKNNTTFELLDGLTKFAVTASDKKKVVLNLFADQATPLRFNQIKDNVDIKEAALRTILSELEDDGIIINNPGAHNTAMYSLNEEKPVS